MLATSCHGVHVPFPVGFLKWSEIVRISCQQSGKLCCCSFQCSRWNSRCILNLHPEIYPDTRHKENDHGLQTSSFAFCSILLVSNWNSAASAAAWDIHLQTPAQVCPFFWRLEGYQLWHDMLGYVRIRFIRAGGSQSPTHAIAAAYLLLL